MVEVVKGDPLDVAAIVNKFEGPCKVIGFSVVIIDNKPVGYAMVEHFRELIEDESNREYMSGYHPYTEDQY